MTKKRVLFVDDEEKILTSFRRAFRNAPFDLDTAKSPDEAIKLVREKQYDLVLSDYRMQGKTGLELLREIKALAPAVKAGILSGFADEKLIEDALAANQIITYLIKPMDNNDLLKEIMKHLEG